MGARWDTPFVCEFETTEMKYCPYLHGNNQIIDMGGPQRTNTIPCGKLVDIDRDSRTLMNAVFGQEQRDTVARIEGWRIGVKDISWRVCVYTSNGYHFSPNGFTSSLSANTL
jgi:hypothetical protein